MSFPNTEQATVINAVRESLLVLAPMGTGKTRTAAAAIERAIGSGIEPERILGLTFTNRAAEAMRAAVAQALPAESHRVQLFNLHGLCARLLREEGKLADLPPDFSILDEDEASELLWQFISKPDRKERYRDKPKQALNAYEEYVVRYLLAESLGPIPPEFRMYRDALYRDGCVDFTGLIARAYRILKIHPEARERWQHRYAWMLVDEVQDINLAEYQIISLLGGLHQCVKFFGDTHQTIYEWRFAQPRDVLDAFTRDFHPTKLALKTNYRCSPQLVDATNALRREFIPSSDAFPEASTAGPGNLTLQEFETSSAETQAVVSQIGTWQREGVALGEIAVLARENRTLVEISLALRGAELPHLVADDFDFFRRQEVKDVTAVLEHLVTPFRRHPILRLLKRFGARAATFEGFEKSCAGTGLHLGYLVRGAPGDPLNALLEAWDRKQILALDTETTGLDPLTSEIIQFSRIGQDPQRTYSELIRPSGKVGSSVFTHGFTDDFLALQGRNVAAVLEEGLRFHPGEILLGHNLAYDLCMLRHACARIGRKFHPPVYFDTMPLAAACLPREQLAGLRLGHVVKALGLSLTEAHHADADALACLQILEKLMPQLREKQPERVRLIAQMGSELGLAFRKVTTLLQQARDLEFTSPDIPSLIAGIWKLLQNTPGEHDYKQNPARTHHVEDLADVARFLNTRRGQLALPTFLEQVSLSRRDMMMDVEPQRVRLLTAHAAKGLEFDAVILPRLVKPWMGYSEEEARVFYVMLTRARRQVWMSWPHKLSDRGMQSTEALKYLSAIKPFCAPVFDA